MRLVSKHVAKSLVALSLMASPLAVRLSWAGTPAAPTSTTDGTLEVRAAETFAKGDYSKALPMLQSFAATLTDTKDKDRLDMVKEQIRVCQKNLTPANPATPVAADAAAVPATQPADATAVASDRTPHPAPKPGETLDMAIKDLGNFDFDDQNPSIPADVKALNGTNIKLHGYMVPLDQAENISRFALVPSLFNCCYGQPPQIQHTIIVTCPKGKAVQYCSDEIVVEGKLKVDTIKDDGYIVGIFAVETTSVKPASK